MDENTENNATEIIETNESETINDSILQTIKKLLGIACSYTQFDQDIIVHINSVFLILNQLGVGPDNGFSIDDDTTIWSDYINEGILLNTIKSYMYLKVRLLFDPPTASSLIDSINRIISELEWRINILVDEGGGAESSET